MAGCGPPAPPALDDAVPPDSTAAAGLDLVALRAWAFYAKLPPAVTALAAPLREASEMRLAWNGSTLLIVARGNFAQPPAGYTALAPGIAAAGASDRIAAAQAGLRTRHGSTLKPAVRAPLWAVIRGDGRLPLAGNLANAGTLLRIADLSTLSAQLRGAAIDLSLDAHCRTEENARRLEESLRAFATVGAIKIGFLRSVHIERAALTVHATASGRPEALSEFF